MKLPAPFPPEPIAVRPIEIDVCNGDECNGKICFSNGNSYKNFEWLITEATRFTKSANSYIDYCKGNLK